MPDTVIEKPAPVVAAPVMDVEIRFTVVPGMVLIRDSLVKQWHEEYMRAHSVNLGKSAAPNLHLKSLRAATTRWQGTQLALLIPAAAVILKHVQRKELPGEFLQRIPALLITNKSMHCLIRSTEMVELYDQILSGVNLLTLADGHAKIHPAVMQDTIRQLFLNLSSFLKSMTTTRWSSKDTQLVRKLQLE